MNKRILEGRCIQEMLTSGPQTLEAIAAKVQKKFGINVSSERVQEHVDYEVSKGRTRKQGKGYVLVSAPHRRVPLLAG